MTDHKIYLITGGTSGLGLEAAQTLANLNRSNVIIVGARRPLHAATLKRVIPSHQLVLLELDTSSLESVKNFVQAATDYLGETKLAGLALNAGVQIVSGDQFSVDGFELTFATNVLGHIALFNGLRHALCQGAVVISTASGTHDKDHKLSRPYNFLGGYFPSAQDVASGHVSSALDAGQKGRDRYATSKLCNILFTYAMGRRYGAEAYRFIAFDPGLMPGTELVRDNTAAIRFAWKNILPTAAKLMDGASTAKKSGELLTALLTQERFPTGTGLHIDYLGQAIATSVLSYDEAIQDDLLTWAEAQITRA